MLLVQEYLKTKSFGELAKEHGVYASFSKSGYKWSLNYDQIEARESDPLAQECRGLILATPDGRRLLATGCTQDATIPGETKILAFPMCRFFNHGQGSCADINWNDPNLSILEKMDGTLCIVYYDPFIDQWCVGTRSVPEADLLMDNGLHTFRSLFEKALRETIAKSDYAGLSFNEWSPMLHKEITYCYELTTPLNRIVVSYPDYRITLIAARHTSTHKELDINQFPLFGVPHVRSYQQMSINDLVDWVSILNPSEHEGVVVRDSKFNRIKIKNASYVAFSKARDTLGHSERNCLELVLLEKEDDVIPFLPEEIVKNLLKIKGELQSFIKQYDEVYLSSRKEADTILPNDKKTFALTIAKKNIWQAPLFQIYDGKCANIKDFLYKSKKDGSYPTNLLDKILEHIKQ